jgi:hypothetical protein
MQFSHTYCDVYKTRDWVLGFRRQRFNPKQHYTVCSTMEAVSTIFTINDSMIAVNATRSHHLSSNQTCPPPMETFVFHSKHPSDVDIPDSHPSHGCNTNPSFSLAALSLLRFCDNSSLCRGEQRIDRLEFRILWEFELYG